MSPETKRLPMFFVVVRTNIKPKTSPALFKENTQLQKDTKDQKLISVFPNQNGTSVLIVPTLLSKHINDTQDTYRDIKHFCNQAPEETQFDNYVWPQEKNSQKNMNGKSVWFNTMDKVNHGFI